MPYLPLDALNELGHGVCIVDGEGRVRLWNERLQRLGLPFKQVEGEPLARVLRPLVRCQELPARLERAIGTVLRSGKTGKLRDVEIDFPTRERQVFHLALSPLRDEEKAVLVIFQDVTEARRTREQYERILDSTPDGVFVIDADRKIRFFNRACTFITGQSSNDILHRGCECSDVINCHTEHGESYASSLCPARGVFRGDIQHQREEMLLTNAGGEERWVETTYSAYPNEDGEIDYVIGILRDVHDRKVLEERLFQTEKLASLGQLVAGIAHEIKNPLGIILSSLDVIQNSERPEDQRQEAAQFIREEIKRIDERLRAFLTFARPREMSLRPTVLSGIIQRHVSTMEMLFPSIAFNVEVAKPEPIVMADEEHLGQVLTNLVLNAGEAMESHGELTLRAALSGGTALLEVEDDGPGIPADYLPRIFDPFFTTKDNGTGLGLSICYQIVLAHRGTISVSRGRKGTGTCFSIRLPISRRFETDQASAKEPDLAEPGR